MANLEQVQKHLTSKQLHYKVIDLGREVFTVKGVSETGVDADCIVKTLIVRTNNDFMALAVRGKDRIDFKKVRRLFGSKSELAKPEEVRKVIGAPVGAICPILVGIPLYFDRKVMDLKHVNMGSGDLKKGLEMEFPDLLKAVGKYEAEDLTN